MQVRNFSIIAHVDHGKSTLADRLLVRSSASIPMSSKGLFIDACSEGYFPYTVSRML